jgi:hypothetical protein
MCSHSTHSYDKANNRHANTQTQKRLPHAPCTMPWRHADKRYRKTHIILHTNSTHSVMATLTHRHTPSWAYHVQVDALHQKFVPIIISDVQSARKLHYSHQPAPLPPPPSSPAPLQASLQHVARSISEGAGNLESRCPELVKRFRCRSVQQQLPPIDCLIDCEVGNVVFGVSAGVIGM